MAAPAAVLAVVRAARPQFRQRADALAFALHAALLAEGFVLVAAGAAAEAEPAAGAALPEAGHDGWNASQDEYAFRYRQEGAASSTVALKALAASGKLFVDAAGTAPAPAAHLELRRVPCCVARRGRARPRLTSVPRSVDDYTTGKLGDGYAEVYSNLEGLLARVRAVLLPALKPEAAPRAEAAAVPAQRAREPEPAYDGGYVGDARCALAGACAAGRTALARLTHARLYARSGWAPERPPGFFGGVGDQDRFPAGMPFIPPLGPMVVPPGRGGGGMLIGPDHPAFFPGGGAPGHPPQLPPGVPPGARFDPYGKQRRTALHPLRMSLTRRFLRRPAGHARLRARALRHRSRQRRAADAGAAAAGAPRHRAARWR